MILDFCANNPPIWKGSKMVRKDANLIYLAETGQLEDYLKKKAERDEAKKLAEAQKAKAAV